jgi:hypothetical protein
MALLYLFFHVATTRHVSILCITFFFRSREIVSSRKITEWIMEDIRDIKRVLKIQEDVHTMVEI